MSSSSPASARVIARSSVWSSRTARCARRRPEVKRRRGARGQRQLKPGWQMLGEHPHAPQRRGRAERVSVVENDHGRPAGDCQRGEQARKHDSRDIGGERVERQAYAGGREIVLHVLEGLEDLFEQLFGVIVTLLQRHPGTVARILAQPLPQQSALAIAGGGTHREERYFRVLLQPGDEPAAWKQPVAGRRTPALDIEHHRSHHKPLSCRAIGKVPQGGVRGNYGSSGDHGLQLHVKPCCSDDLHMRRDR